VRSAGRACVSTTASRGSSSSARLARAALWGTERQAAREESLPFATDLLIEAVSDEDEETLKRGNESHEHEEDNVDNVHSGENCIQEGKEPRETDRDEN